MNMETREKKCVFAGKWTFPIWVTTTFVSLVALWINTIHGNPKEETYDDLFAPYIVATCRECNFIKKM